MNEEQLIELAENANTYTPLGPTDVRIVNDRYVLWMGAGDEPGWNVAQRFRLRAAEVEDVRAELHEILRKRGRTALTWEIGTHATPGDLTERLLALGLVDDEPTPLAVGMVLTGPPGGIAARRRGSASRTPDERLASARIAAVAFGGPVPTKAAAAERRCGQCRLPGLRRRRSRGASIGLVRQARRVVVRRGDAARGARPRRLSGPRGPPAGRTRSTAERPCSSRRRARCSRPILARLGFREVCEIRILLDKFA